MNIQAIKNYLDCDNTFLLSLVQKFIEEAKSSTRKIELALQNQNQKGIKLNAHKFLSSAKILELNELSTLLEKIELNASKTGFTELEEDIKQLSVIVDQIIQDMLITIKELES